MAWNEALTHFTGKTHEYLHPWVDKQFRENEHQPGVVFRIPSGPLEIKKFVRESQELGLVVGLFCPRCLAELDMDASFKASPYDGVPTKGTYTCPNCQIVWQWETQV